MPRSFLFTILVGYCFGLLLSARWHLPPWWMSATIGLAALCLSITKTRLLGWALLALFVAALRWQALTAVTADRIERYVGQAVTMTGAVSDLPTIDSNHQTLTVRDITVHGRRVDGAISLILPAHPQAQIGTKVTFACTVKNFSSPIVYKRLVHNIRATCAAAGVQDHGQVKGVRSWLGSVRQGIVTIVTKNFPQPQSSFLIGLLLGGGATMPPDLIAAFQATGTTHIIALSGFNVTIIVAVISVVMIRWFGRRWAWIPALGVVLLFVVMTGASASVVRAAVMAIMAQVALWFGRPVAMTRLLIYTALAMLVVNPCLLQFDLGFQLSFLATIGLVFCSRPLQSWLTFVPARGGLRQNAGATMGAMLVTEPWILWTFGRFSLIAPLINVMVLPFIPLAMGLGALTVLALWIVPTLGGFLVPVTDMLLHTVLWVIESGAHTTAASLQLSAVWSSVVASVFILVAVLVLQKNAKMDPR